jgi:hypothetical protein
LLEQQHSFKKKDNNHQLLFFWMMHWWALGHASHFGLDGSFRFGTSSGGLQIWLTSNPDLHWLFYLQLQCLKNKSKNKSFQSF